MSTDPSTANAPDPPKKSPRAFWQIVAAVLGNPVMRSIKEQPDAAVPDEESTDPEHLSDLYPPPAKTPKL